MSVQIESRFLTAGAWEPSCQAAEPNVLNPETKVAPAYGVGKRDLPTATALADFSARLANRVEIFVRRTRDLSAAVR